MTAVKFLVFRQFYAFIGGARVDLCREYVATATSAGAAEALRLGVTDPERNVEGVIEPVGRRRTLADADVAREVRVAA